MTCIQLCRPDILFTDVPLLHVYPDSFFVLSFLSCLNLHFLFSDLTACCCLSACPCDILESLQSVGSRTAHLAFFWHVALVAGGSCQMLVKKEALTWADVRYHLVWRDASVCPVAKFSSPSSLPSCLAPWLPAAYPWAFRSSGLSALATATQE